MRWSWKSFPTQITLWFYDLSQTRGSYSCLQSCDKIRPWFRQGPGISNFCRKYFCTHSPPIILIWPCISTASFMFPSKGIHFLANLKVKLSRQHFATTEIWLKGPGSGRNSFNPLRKMQTCGFRNLIYCYSPKLFISSSKGSSHKAPQVCGLEQNLQKP